MQILGGEKKVTKCLKEWIWEGLSLHLEGVGTVWAVFSALFDCFCDALNPSFFKYGSRMRSKRPFGSILGRFWRVLGGFGMDF